MSETIHLRQQNPDETDSMAQYESPNGDDVCASYLSRKLAEPLGEFAAATVTEGDDAVLDAISGSGSGNYAVFETPGGAITGFYLSHDVWANVLGREVERDDDGNVTNAPENIGLELAPATEEDFEEAGEADDEEVDSLLADAADEDEVEVSEADEAEELLEEVADE